MQKKYHLIAIGGSVMHNVAIDLFELGHNITGSDDEIYEPSRSRLEERGLLPEKMGWDENRIHPGLDAVILGKHARLDNPELIKAQQIGVPILSFPEFISKNSNATTRVCIAGSHGKTSTTSIIMHVCKAADLDFDYLVGAQIEGFSKMVKISNADLLICEGDEYPSSALDNRAKMLHYNANISVITGLAWDHINIYKTYDDYKAAFKSFLETMPNGSICFYDQTDNDLQQLMIEEKFSVIRQSYLPFEKISSSQIGFENEKYNVELFGEHNMKNLKAAYLVCSELGISKDAFFQAIETYKGASKRLELIFNNENLKVYRDFAHAPSKCKATVDAIRSKYPDRKVKAILELHTFSSLNKEYIRNYSGTMNQSDTAFVFFDEMAVSRKQMPELNKDEVERSFEMGGLTVINDSMVLKNVISDALIDGTEILLIMSSGGLAGIDLFKIFE